MEVEIHERGEVKIAELVSAEIILRDINDGLDLLGNLYYQGFDRIIIHEKNITPDFFELKNGLAGEMLQKFSNYRVKLVIVGDFAKYKSKSLNDFIYESNKGSLVGFLSSQKEAINTLVNL